METVRHKDWDPYLNKRAHLWNKFCHTPLNLNIIYTNFMAILYLAYFSLYLLFLVRSIVVYIEVKCGKTKVKQWWVTLITVLKIGKNLKIKYVSKIKQSRTKHAYYSLKN